MTATTRETATATGAAGQIRYTMLIQWSDQDGAYVVSLPEWEGRVFNPVTHGATYEEAARNGLEVLEGIVAIANEHGWPLPEPPGVRAVAPAS
jgi:predicted RNase H-like HicB family nuclease